MRVFVLRVLILVAITACGRSESECQSDPQCAYESCMAVKELMKKQGRSVGDTMQCARPARSN